MISGEATVDNGVKGSVAANNPLKFESKDARVMYETRYKRKIGRFSDESSTEDIEKLAALPTTQAKTITKK